MTERFLFNEAGCRATGGWNPIVLTPGTFNPFVKRGVSCYYLKSSFVFLYFLQGIFRSFSFLNRKTIHCIFKVFIILISEEPYRY